MLSVEMIFLYFSIILFIGIIAGAILDFNKRINRKSEYNLFAQLLTNQLVAILLLFFSIVFIKYGTGIYTSSQAGLFKIPAFKYVEIFADSVIHALQSFSMDENYSEALTTGKEMIFLRTNSHLMVKFYSFYVSGISIIAPIAGGAMILDLIVSIFPKLKFNIYKLVFKNREKYIFSELNDKSLALAESVLDKSSFWKRPLLIFTDAYLDNEQEKSSELFKSAKNLGAICLSDDIINLNIANVKNKLLFLIDENEKENALTLSKFADEKNFSLLTNNAKVYVFYKDDNLTLLQTSVAKSMKKIAIKGGMTSEALSNSIIRVNCYQNLAFDILQKYPLYYPIRKNETNDLKISIIGGGKIGTEMFLASSWAGQLYGINLHINVASQEKRNEFERKINSINPEILESTTPGHDSLKIFSDRDDKSEPYFNFGYAEINAKAYSPEKVEFDNNDNLLDSDYVLVCLGSDEMNIQYADQLSRSKKIDSSKKKEMRILYVVYDDGLCNMLNSVNSKCENNVYLTAIGNLNSLYSYENIVTDELYPLVKNVFQKTYNSHNKMLFDSDEQTLKGQYNYWSTVAKTIHLPYRVFNALRLNNSEIEVGEELKTSDLKEYYSILEDKRKELGDNEIVKKLTWLEHRRWNAYLRSQGYRSVNKDTEKNFNLRIHPCIVEFWDSSLEYIDKETGKPITPPIDKLDEVGDYKIYDNPYVCDDYDEEYDIDNKTKILEFFEEMEKN